MSWHKMSESDKRQYLSKQLEDIEHARALIDRFEKLTNKWLEKLSAPAKKAPGEKASKRQ